MEYFEPPPATLADIAALHGVTAEQVRPIRSGVANRTFLLGDELVLRIPRARRFVADLVKEAAVIPVARRAGVRTPEVVAFDGTCSTVGVPHMVLTRVPGVELGECELTTAEAESVHRQLGREVARLHRAAGETTADLPTVPVDDGTVDPAALVGDLLAAGWIDAETSRWLTEWFGFLTARVPHDPPRALVHGDIAPQNLLVAPRPAQLTGVVDWGDARWADPATEFAKVPLVHVPAMLDGYRQEADGDAAEHPWEARVLRVRLVWALGRLSDPAPRPGERHWTAPPASRLLDLLRFFASRPPARWADLAWPGPTSAVSSTSAASPASAASPVSSVSPVSETSGSM